MFPSKIGPSNLLLLRGCVKVSISNNVCSQNFNVYSALHMFFDFTFQLKDAHPKSSWDVIRDCSFYVCMPWMYANGKEAVLAVAPRCTRCRARRVECIRVNVRCAAGHGPSSAQTISRTLQRHGSDRFVFVNWALCGNKSEKILGWS